MKFVHFRNGQQCGGATGAFEVEGETINIGVAFCSMKDQFNKSLGRKIASGRLNNTKTEYRFTIATPMGVTKDEIISRVRDAILCKYSDRFDGMIEK